jgi:hypothetical protein
MNNLNNQTKYMTFNQTLFLIVVYHTTFILLTAVAERIF